MTPSAISLPQEIIDVVVDQFADVPQILCTLSLTHRIFLHRCQKHLFGVIEIAHTSHALPTPFASLLDYSNDRALQKITLLRSPLSLIPTVISHLTLTCGGSISHTQEFLSSPITNIRSLRLQDAFFDVYSEDQKQLLPAFLELNPNLEELQLWNTTIADLRQLFPYPLPQQNSLSHLESLTVNTIIYRPSRTTALVDHIADIFATEQKSFATHRLRSLTIGELEPELLDFWFLHPRSLFCMNNSNHLDTGCACRKCARPNLKFLPLENKMSYSYADFLNVLGSNIETLELMRAWDWQPVLPSTSEENILFSNLAYLTIGCAEAFSLNDMSFFPWLARLIRGTPLKQLVFHISLYPWLSSDDLDQGYVDPLDNEGNEEEDDGGATGREETFDERLALFLGEAARGDFELKTPEDKKLRISIMATRTPYSRSTPGDVVERYMRKTSEATRELGMFEIEMGVLDE